MRWHVTHSAPLGQLGIPRQRQGPRPALTTVAFVKERPHGKKDRKVARWLGRDARPNQGALLCGISAWMPASAVPILVECRSNLIHGVVLPRALAATRLYTLTEALAPLRRLVLSAPGRI
jgi:hypothetical protein